MHEYLQRSKFVIARPGYTSVMELIQLGLKGLFIPTPGQIEQVYLAQYYEENKWCHCVSQYSLDLKRDVEIAKSYSGFPTTLNKSKDNVKNLVKKYFS